MCKKNRGLQSFNLNVDKNMLFKFCLHCIYVLCICMLILLRFTTFWNTKSNSISNFHEIQQNWETYPSHIVNVVIEWLLFKIESFNPKMQHLETPTMQLNCTDSTLSKHWFTKSLKPSHLLVFYDHKFTQDTIYILVLFCVILKQTAPVKYFAKTMVYLYKTFLEKSMIVKKMGAGFCKILRPSM